MCIIDIPNVHLSMCFFVHGEHDGQGGLGFVIMEYSRLKYIISVIRLLFFLHKIALRDASTAYMLQKSECTMTWKRETKV